MDIFTYPLFYKLFFRYGNIPLTLLLAAYLISSAAYIDKHIIYLIPVIITLFLIYFLNKQFANLYKVLPYRITAYDNRIICEDFLFSKKEIIILYKDIESLKGGIFEGRLRGILRVCDGRNKICIGYFDRIKNSQKLGTLLLSKVKKNVYDEVLKKISKVSSKRKK